ncbi:PqqD family protein [Salinarimonas rosea]|uniref:PqqD family protein n=1 Tax=Salinarimonas rosea TaxID=552063 RepID=UPI00041C177E|nr:PqqD family protein [Salinarimonas rosea]
MDRELAVTASPSCVECDFGDGLVVLDLESNTYFRLDAVGTVVWRALSEPGETRTLGDLVARVTSTYDVDEARCRSDLSGLLERMAERRLVRLSAGGDDAAPLTA